MHSASFCTLFFKTFNCGVKKRIFQRYLFCTFFILLSFLLKKIKFKLVWKRSVEKHFQLVLPLFNVVYQTLLFFYTPETLIVGSILSVCHTPLEPNSSTFSGGLEIFCISANVSKVALWVVSSCILCFERVDFSVVMSLKLIQSKLSFNLSWSAQLPIWYGQ